MAFLCLLHRLASLLFHFVSFFTSSFFLTKLLFTFLFLPYILCVARRAIQIGIMSDVCCCFRHLHFTRHGLIIFSYTTHAYIHTYTHTQTRPGRMRQIPTIYVCYDSNARMERIHFCHLTVNCVM